MAEVIKVRRSASNQAAYDSYANNMERLMAGNSRGAGLVLPEHFAAVAEGRMFVANIGTATTPTSFAKTTYDADQPQFVIDVPSGKAIQPIVLKVVLETEAGTLNEVIWSVSDGLIGAGTSTAVTPANARTQSTGSQPSSGCDLYSLYTGNGTAPSNGFEFARFSSPFVLSDGDPHNDHRYQWKAAEEGWSPLIQGTGALVCHIVGASTAPTGYLTAVWWEMDTEVSA